jgi:hypothetical protein
MVLSSYNCSAVSQTIMIIIFATRYPVADGQCHMDPLSIASAAIAFAQAASVIGDHLKFLKGVPKARSHFWGFVNEVSSCLQMRFISVQPQDSSAAVKPAKLLLTV